MRAAVTNRRRRLVTAVAAVVALVALARGPVLSAPGAHALFADSAVVTDELDATVLDPPQDLAIAASFGTVSLTWTPSPIAAATGIEVLRASTIGGPYAVIATVAPTATGFSESPGLGTFAYVVRTAASNWRSGNSNEVNTVFSTISTPWLSCTAQAADTGGDGNGYEVASASSCADDNVPADDVNSGTGTSTSCTNTRKDRHRFSGFGVSVPALATIRGIEVRTQSWLKSATTGTNRICVQLSTDGGATWTTAVTSSALTATEAVYTFGSTSSLWGRTFTPAQLADGVFRVRVVNVAAATNKRFAIDTVQVRVTYS
jgi:hypothetical protein